MSQTPRAGTPVVIGRYRVVGRLGEGGMGTVYRGVDDSGRGVAIKVIRREYAADPQYRARFQAEVAAAQRVRPFCTAPVLDADPHADPPYLVTEFVEGPSLDDAVTDRGPLRGADLEALAVGMATALTAIHDAGIVHRDLKPANVLLSPLGPRVIDFGIARSELDGTRLTATGGIVGTPAFMAPEQLAGASASPATDVFAWGATVAFAARAKPCFDGPTVPAIIHRIVSGEPDLTGLQGTVLEVVRAALAKDPARRPTAQQLLEHLISGAPRISGAPKAAPASPPVPSPHPGDPPVPPGGLAPARPDGAAAWPGGAAARPDAASARPGAGTWQALPQPALDTDAAVGLVEQQYRQAAEAGDSAAMYQLGVLLSARGQTAEADYWYRRATAAMDTPPPGNGHPGYGVPATRAGHAPGLPAAAGRYNTTAICALILGVVGLLTCGLSSIPAIIFGHLGWNQTRRAGQKGLGMAAAGIACGWVMVGIWLLIGLAFLISDDSSTSGTF
ncbi:protein kinase [Actinomadura sp. NPDC047616]|uniref:protein kinase domain-containing protein n=1 Tax=Actinomadura sp. NPDC047616 TaxID=3155914 RepID=UPI0034076840